MADAIAITVDQLPQSLGERAAKAFDIQRFVDVLCYASQTSTPTCPQQVNGMALLHPLCPEGSENDILRET